MKIVTGGVNVARVIARLGGEAHPLWSRGGDMGSRIAQPLERLYQNVRRQEAIP